MSDSQPLRLVVEPKPSDREVAAITAAVLAMNTNNPQPATFPAANPWREANKRESMRAFIKENRS